MAPIDLALFIVKILLSLLNCSGVFVINEVIMKKEFVLRLYFVPLIKLIIPMPMTHCFNY